MADAIVMASTFRGKVWRRGTFHGVSYAAIAAALVKLPKYQNYAATSMRVLLVQARRPQEAVWLGYMQAAERGDERAAMVVEALSMRPNSREV